MLVRVRLLIALCLSSLLGGLVIWTLAQDGPLAEQPSATPLEASATPSGNYVSVDARLAYVRSGPGRNYDIVGQLLPGQRVVPVSRDVTGNWILIRYQDEEQGFDGFAWIARNLVRWVNPSGLSRLHDDANAQRNLHPFRHPDQHLHPFRYAYSYRDAHEYSYCDPYQHGDAEDADEYGDAE